MLEHNLDLKYDVVIGSIADSDVSQFVEYIEMGSTDINRLSVYELFTDDGRTLGEQMSLHTHKSLKCVKKRVFMFWMKGGISYEYKSIILYELCYFKLNKTI